MHYLPLLGTIIVTAGSVPYLIATIQGRVRPRLVSWGVWALLAGILTVSAYVSGEYASATLSFGTFLSCGAITFLAVRRGSIAISRFDIVCLIGAVAGIASLFIFDSPTIAALVAVTVDAIAFVPTLIHGWQSPEEESLACFAISSLGASLALIASVGGGMTLVGMAYPTYAVAFNGLMSLVLVIGRYGRFASFEYRQDEA